MCGLVECILWKINILFIVGGGIVLVELVRVVLCVGVDKVSINFVVVRRFVLICELVDEFGS